MNSPEYEIRLTPLALEMLTNIRDKREQGLVPQAGKLESYTGSSLEG